MRRLILLFLTCVLGVVAADSPPIHVSLRTRVELFKGSGDWREVWAPAELQPSRSAIVICDMWDKHWCRGASNRVDALARKAVPLLQVARERGFLIIHAPSDTMAFYKTSPERLAILAVPQAAPPPARDISDPALPIDDAGGGCDTGDAVYKAWSREHPAIPIVPGDLVSDKGSEIYSALKQRGITTLLVMGVHTNMCVLNRSFAIKQMTRWGVPCVLIRDLTDAMYDPQDKPHVSHDRGTELVVEHIEKYWAPSVLSTQLLDAMGGRR